MSVMSHNRLSFSAQSEAHTFRFCWIESDEVALTEDLIEGFKENTWLRRGVKSAVGVSSVAELMRELDTGDFSSRRILVMRGAERCWTQKWKEAIKLRVAQYEKVTGLLVLMVSSDPLPEDLIEEWSESPRLGVARVKPPSLEKVGDWLSTRAAGKYDYRKNWDSPLDPKMGLRFFEHVGFDYTAAIQGCRTLQRFEGEGLSWGRISGLVPRQVLHGYSDVLVAPGGRERAIRLAEGVLPSEVGKVLGALRWRLRIFGQMRAIQAELYPPAEVADQLGMDKWWYQTKFNPFYGHYTEERIRRRLRALDRATDAVRSGETTGPLEVLAWEW